MLKTKFPCRGSKRIPAPIVNLKKMSHSFEEIARSYTGWRIVRSNPKRSADVTQSHATAFQGTLLRSIHKMLYVILPLAVDQQAFMSASTAAHRVMPRRRTLKAGTINFGSGAITCVLRTSQRPALCSTSRRGRHDRTVLPGNRDPAVVATGHRGGQANRSALKMTRTSIAP